MTQANLSVIIVNYNSGEHITECVKSVIRCAPEAEVIVVDNASSDESISLLESTFVNYPQLKVIRNQSNLGFSVACNIGTENTVNEYLLYLNPDCMIYESTIPKLFNCLQADDTVRMVGGRLLNADGSEQPGGRRAVPTPWRTFVRVFNLSFLSKRYPRLFSDFNLHQQEVPEHPIEVEAISGACMLINRETFKAVGGLDEKYFLHCEDLDWCMRFRLNGGKIMFVPDAILTHFQGACSEPTPVVVEWYKHKGMMRFYRKFFRHQYPGILMWIVAVGVWLRFSLLACYFYIRRFMRWIKSAKA
ncbi:glycosyltransferase family 2 protein [Gimesia aquarii]|uniref:N-acetylglucosaminyl-diphospho-decaprenol L-rhamnosyltransferase n=1 Tax=Gimesia aquarii TaxID=2527964 RepID=A0A517W3U8_9PLAN|nr:glycosyltransferase family 2 protein [Gimesia aquarii]QDT99925.1 N-acetylglucosaminyl-diphospho-decaprenol L-rhamnosyltransferase [Gimesia aquarii]